MERGVLPVAVLGRERQLLRSPRPGGAGPPGPPGATALSVVVTVLLQAVFVQRVTVLKVRARGLGKSGSYVWWSVARGEVGGRIDLS